MSNSTTGQFDRAEDAYRQAIENDRNPVEAYVGLAKTLSQRGQTAAAQATWRQAPRARPRYWSAYDAHGGFLMGRRRVAQALAQYRQAAGLAPDNASVHSNLGGTYFRLRDFANASVAFQRSVETVEIAPTSEAYPNTATMYYYSSRDDEATATFERATVLAPEDHVLWGNLADAYRVSTQQASLARQTYDRAPALGCAPACASIPRIRSPASCSPPASCEATGNPRRARRETSDPCRDPMILAAGQVAPMHEHADQD